MAATNGIVREALDDLDARLDHWNQTLVDLCRAHGAFAFTASNASAGSGLSSQDEL